jgi:Bacterial Ig-like domain (group 3)/FG-GAP-like repeat
VFVTRLLLFLAALSGTSPLFATCPSIQWSLQHQQAAGIATWGMLILDYDGDTVPDLLSVEGGNSGDGTLFTRRGVGNGTFEAPATFAEHVGGSMAAADVDGNGTKDLVLISPSGSFQVRLGTGTGFGAPVPYFPDHGVSRVYLGNYDADPAVELLTVSAGSGVVVLYDNSGGVFVELQRVSTGALPMGAAAADFDGDGRTDIVVGERIPKTVSVFFRNVNGTFAAPVILPTGDYPVEVAVGDVNEDGLPDFVLSQWTDGDVRVYRNAGSRQFTQTSLSIDPPAAPKPGPEGFALLLRDLNGDGHLDILAPAINGPGGVITFAGAGNGTFLTPTWTLPTIFDAGVIAVAAGDLNNDTVTDVVASSFNQQYIFSKSCTTQVYATARSRTITLGQDALIDTAVSGFSATPPADRGTLTAGGVTTAPGIDGRALIHVPGLTTGQHQLSVDFSGNNDVAAATSEPVTIDVTTATTTTTLSTPATPPVYGTPWPVNVQITSSANPGASFTYWTLIVDGTETSQIVGVPAQLNLTPGPHTIQARFEGFSIYPPSDSAVLPVTATKATPTVTSTGTLTVRLGTAHTLQFPVTGPANTVTPTGTVQLFEGATLLATASLVNGIASPSPAALPRGAHDVRATYSGDANFLTATTNVTLEVLPNTPLVIEARALPAGVHIAYVLPPNTTSSDLYRRVAGTVTWQWVSGWNASTGMDPDVLPRGVVHEYQLRALSNGTLFISNTDSALLFNDDLLTIGTTIKRAHFVELRQAVNEIRATASLGPFDYEAGFGTSPLVRASHIAALRTAINQARTVLGMTTATFPAVTAGTTPILASDVQQVRELAR